MPFKKTSSNITKQVSEHSESDNVIMFSATYTSPPREAASYKLKIMKNLKKNFTVVAYFLHIFSFRLDFTNMTHYLQLANLELILNRGLQ